MATKGVWETRLRIWRDAGVTKEQARTILASLDRNYQAGLGSGVFGTEKLAQFAKDKVDEVYSE